MDSTNDNPSGTGSKKTDFTKSGFRVYNTRRDSNHTIMNLLQLVARIPAPMLAATWNSWNDREREEYLSQGKMSVRRGAVVINERAYVEFTRHDARIFHYRNGKALL